MLSGSRHRISMTYAWLAKSILETVASTTSHLSAASDDNEAAPSRGWQRAPQPAGRVWRAAACVHGTALGGAIPRHFVAPLGVFQGVAPSPAPCRGR
eukprot:scaffold1106_cov608-Prasinococcus_capsulatus_cf.AAC.7